MNTAEIKELHQHYVMSTYNPGVALVKGSGARVWDADGREYLDFLAGISVVNVGHCHPQVVQAIQQQTERLMHVSNIYYNENQPQLAKVLSEKSLGGKCFFCNSGAEANEALIKLARLWGSSEGRYEVITMRQSFHGRTLATLTATGQDKVQKGFSPLPEGFQYAEFNNLDSVAATVGEKTVAILVEAVQGEGGICPADPAFMTGLRALCDEKNLLLLVDEVQSGMGRTGKWFAYQHYGIEPDAISIAKALGNGVPIAAVAAGEKLSDVFRPGHHATTFGGTPLACAAALAVFDVIEKEDLLNNTRETGHYFQAGLERVAEQFDFISGVRGLGLMLALVVTCPPGELVAAMLEQGLLSLVAGGGAVRFLPPLNVTRAEVDEALQLIEQACTAYAAGTGHA